MAFIVYKRSAGLAPTDGMGGGGGVMGMGNGWQPVYSPKPASGGLVSCAFDSKKDRRDVSDDKSPLAPIQHSGTQTRSANSASATNTAAFAFLASRPPASVQDYRSRQSALQSSSSSPSLSPSPPTSVSSPSNATLRLPSYHPIPPTHPHHIANMACVQEPRSATGPSTGMSPLFSGPPAGPSPFYPQLRDPLAPPPIDSLPPELLDAVLAAFPTPALLPLASVSRRFHVLVARLLYRRLRRAVALANYQLILACYHPSAKISTPYLHCAYLGTDGLSDDPNDDTLLERLPNMYSRFRPVPPDEADVHVRNYRAIRRTMNFFMLSDTASGGTAATALQTVANGEGGPVEASQIPLVAYDVHLDEGELFSQLCTVTNLVKTSSRPGLFLNCVNINDGVIRVWRDWLSGRVKDQADRSDKKGEKVKDDRREEKEKKIPSIADDPNQHVLWAYTGKHVGMRFRVTERASPLAQPPNLANNRRATAPVEEPPVSFQLEYEELVVQTYELLLAMEAAEVQDATSSGRGVIVASL
ncbi:hypothetical protein SBRCBS47491_002121 [Sporothrix bragantina]|uniref:F-box domain-containing protein n=1 Tax=Sporothrix bragantina TaxID=671064 RepID=A0ABP0B4D2_9PEZI